MTDVAQRHVLNETSQLSLQLTKGFESSAWFGEVGDPSNEESVGGEGNCLLLRQATAFPGWLLLAHALHRPRRLFRPPGLPV
jgi:hypothetical protein